MLAKVSDKVNLFILIYEDILRHKNGQKSNTTVGTIWHENVW